MRSVEAPMAIAVLPLPDRGSREASDRSRPGKRPAVGVDAAQRVEPSEYEIGSVPGVDWNDLHRLDRRHDPPGHGPPERRVPVGSAGGPPAALGFDTCLEGSPGIPVSGGGPAAPVPDGLGRIPGLKFCKGSELHPIGLSSPGNLVSLECLPRRLIGQAQRRPPKRRRPVRPCGKAWWLSLDRCLAKA